MTPPAGGRGRRRDRRRRPVVLGLALVLLASGLAAAATAAAPAPASARGQRVLLLGDSVMAAFNYTYGSGGLTDLRSAYATTVDARVCRRLVAASCLPGVPTALQTLVGRRGSVGDALVVAVGYNDDHIDAEIDAIVGEAVAQGVRRVVWLTYRNWNGRYRGENASLEAATARWPQLRVADWDGWSAGHPEWFVDLDGHKDVHLTGGGAAALAVFVRASLDRFLTDPRCEPDGASGTDPAAGAGGAAAPSPVAGGFHPLPPVRLVDTRADDADAVTAKLGAGRVLAVPVEGLPASAVGVAVNLTAVGACGPGFLTAFPCGTAVPTASNLNTTEGAIVANLAVVPLGRGSVCLYASTQTDVVVDLEGWFGRGGLGLAPTALTRLVDTRPGFAQALPLPQARLGAGATLAVPLAGAGAALTITAVGASAPGYLTVWPGPCSGPRPLASNTNTGAAGAVANLVLVSAGTDGTACVFSSTATDLVIDRAAELDAGAPALTLAAPARAVDTRVAPGRLAPGAALAVPMPGARAALVNLTAVTPDRPGFLTMWGAGPAGVCDPSTRPATSNVNFEGGAIVANLAVVQPGGRTGCVSSNTGTDVIADVQAWTA